MSGIIFFVQTISIEKFLPFLSHIIESFLHKNYIIKMGDLNQGKRQEQNFQIPSSLNDHNICESKRNVGCWLKEQQKKYVQFISFSRKSLQSKNQRKNSRVFKQMALYIGTRDGIQCRSHHMKQMKIHKQLRKVIDNFYQDLEISKQDGKISSFAINHIQQNVQQSGNFQKEAQELACKSYQSQNIMVMLYPQQMAIAPECPFLFFLPQFEMQQFFLLQNPSVSFQK